MNRRWIVFLFLLFTGLILSQRTLAQRETAVLPQFVDIFPTLRFDSPVDITHAGDERLFVVERPGRILIIGAESDKPLAQQDTALFLDIASKVTSGGESGLLGLAFHPNYASNGYFYVNYTHNLLGSLHTRIARYQVSDNPNSADPNSEQILLDIPQPFANHNAGDLAFGPDGYLYIPLGDGGSGGDPDNRAQNLDDLLGKILRLDVDNSTPAQNYAVPANNPFVGRDGLDEIWAYGLRNPWRISFDRATGDLFIGDVGQNQWEEIDWQPAASNGGENYGWRLKEGGHCFNPSSNCDPGGLVDPIYEYQHGEGCRSVTGGFVYRGAAYPALRGIYLLADFCTGMMVGLQQVENGRFLPRFQTIAPTLISTFGEDAAGELYMATLEGVIYQVQTKPLPLSIHLPLLKRQ